MLTNVKHADLLLLLNLHIINQKIESCFIGVWIVWTNFAILKYNTQGVINFEHKIMLLLSVET